MNLNPSEIPLALCAPAAQYLRLSSPRRQFSSSGLAAVIPLSVNSLIFLAIGSILVFRPSEQ